ncbi:DNA-binding protein, partial [Tannerella forsythia]
MMESDEIKSIQENLKDIQGVLSEIHGFMRDLKKDYSPVDESISLDS